MMSHPSQHFTRQYRLRVSNSENQSDKIGYGFTATYLTKNFNRERLCVPQRACVTPFLTHANDQLSYIKKILPSQEIKTHDEPKL